MFHNNIPFRVEGGEGKILVSVGEDYKEFSGEDFSEAVKWMTGVMRDKYPQSLCGGGVFPYVAV